MKYNIRNGLQKAYIAKVEAGGTWATPVELGDLIEISIKASENSVSLRAGNGVIMVDTALGEIDVTLSVPSLSEENEALLFGHKLAEGGGLIKSSLDVKPYFALLFEGTAKDSETGAEVTDYATLFKGQFNLAERKGKTKEGTPELQTTPLSAKFMPDVETGIWMHTVSTDSDGFDKTSHATKWTKSVEFPKEKVEAGS